MPAFGHGFGLESWAEEEQRLPVGSDQTLALRPDEVWSLGQRQIGYWGHNVAAAGSREHQGDDRVAMRVPFVDLRRQAAELQAEYDAAFCSIVARAAYTMGP